MSDAYDIMTPTSVGTGVARTSIGTLNKPATVQNLVEFIPYYVSSGAYTAAESLLIQFEMTNQSVNSLLPKKVILPPTLGGLGTFAQVTSPILESYRCNTMLQNGATSTFEGFGTAQIANTVAPVVGCALHYDELPPNDVEFYYDKPTDETNTGTAATTVAGNSVTINGGTMLRKLYAAVTAGTVTASESFIGDMQFSSNDFENSLPLKVPIQPISAGLGTAVSLANLHMATYNCRMGMKLTTTINTAYRQSEALTATGNFIGAVSYIKS